MTTLRDQFERALRLKGLTIAKTTHKWIVYNAIIPGFYWYVGSRGSLRHGPSVQASRAVGDETKRRLLAQVAAGQK